MLIELGDKRYTVVAKFRHWREFQRQVTQVEAARASEEDSAKQADAADKVLDIGCDYLNRHVTKAERRTEDGGWEPDPDWEGEGSAEDKLEPDVALALIGRVASPTESPFA